MSIIERFTRHALPINEGTFSEPPSGWDVLGGDELREALDEHRRAIERAVACVGRVEIEGHPYLDWAGAGVLVAPYLFLTARHVAALFANGSGDAGIALNSGMKAFFTAGASTGSRDEFRLPVTQVRFLHPYFDVALCELGPGTTTQADEDSKIGIPIGLRLVAEAPTPIADRKVAVIGFAEPDPRNDAADMARVFGAPMEPTLYLMPGELRELATRVSGPPSIPSIAHDCSTTGGSSGAPLVDLETGHVMGVNFGGIEGEANWATPSWLLARDPRVRASGIQFTDDSDWQYLWAIADIAAAQDGLVKGGSLGTLTPDSAEPEPDPEIHYFTQTELYRIRDLLTDTRLALPDRQHLLFVAMSTMFISKLPTEGAPDARLVATLGILNQTPRLISGELPMQTLLLNAVENSKEFPQSEKLREFLDRLPGAG